MTAQVLCRDAFARHPESLVGLAGGAQCSAPVVGPGWMCDTHSTMAHTLLSQEIADELPKGKSGGGPGVANVDPVLAAKVAAAAEFLAGYAGRNSFLLDLRADRRYGTKWFRITERMADAILAVRDREAAWAEQAARTATQPKAQATEGWYKHEGAVYKVQLAVHGSGRPYAKKLDIPAGVKPGTVRGEWVYAPGMVSKLTEADRLTTEEAQALGRLYGICMVCGAILTDEESIERGIGPVCGGRLAKWLGEE